MSDPSYSQPPQRPAVKLPRWLGGAEFSEVSQLAERWWTFVQGQLEKAVVLQDALNCPESALYLHAWQWGITRFPAEPLELFRKRIYYAPINNLDAGSTQGLKNIFQRLELGAVEIYERIEGYDWDEVIVRVSNRQLAESELIRFIVATYGLSARRYYIEVLDQVDLVLPAFSAECDYRCYAPDKGFIPLPPYEPGPEPLDDDAQDIIDMLATPLTAAQSLVLSNAIKYAKGANPYERNTWARLDALAFFVDVPTQELALIDWRRKIRMSVVNASMPAAQATWSKAGGFGKTGTSASHINTLFTPSSDCVIGTVSDDAMAVYEVQRGAGNSGASLAGSRSGTATTLVYFQVSVGGEVSGAINNNNLVSVPQGVQPSDGIDQWNCISRSDTTLTLFENDAVAGARTGVAASALSPQPIYLLALNNNGSASNGYIGNQGAWLYGASMTADDMRVLAGVRAILAAMPA